MSTSRRRAALAAFPVALGLLLAGPVAGTASAATQVTGTTASTQSHGCLICVDSPYPYPYGHIDLLGLHLGLWLHL